MNRTRWFFLKLLSVLSGWLKGLMLEETFPVKTHSRCGSMSTQKDRVAQKQTKRNIHWIFEKSAFKNQTFMSFNSICKIALKRSDRISENYRENFIKINAAQNNYPQRVIFLVSLYNKDTKLISDISDWAQCFDGKMSDCFQTGSWCSWPSLNPLTQTQNWTELFTVQHIKVNSTDVQHPKNTKSALTTDKWLKALSSAVVHLIFPCKGLNCIEQLLFCNASKCS